MTYEDIEIGDVVCATTSSGDLDIKTLGIVTKKLDKSTYEDMKVIYVSHYYNVQNYSDFGCFAPKNLVKLTTQQLYHILKCQKSFNHYTNIQIRR